MFTFTPDCTYPPSSPAFVAGAPIRSTLDIVWSCFGILILCTWSILHLSVPPQTRPRGLAQNLARVAYLTARKLKWMTITLLAPEFVLGKAWGELASARESVADMETKGFPATDGAEWGLVHAFYADMGGFVIEFESEPVDGEEEQEAKEETVGVGGKDAEDAGAQPRREAGTDVAQVGDGEEGNDRTGEKTEAAGVKDAGKDTGVEPAKSTGNGTAEVDDDNKAEQGQNSKKAEEDGVTAAVEKDARPATHKETDPVQATTPTPTVKASGKTSHEDKNPTAELQEQEKTEKQHQGTRQGVQDTQEVESRPKDERGERGDDNANQPSKAENDIRETEIIANSAKRIPSFRPSRVATLPPSVSTESGSSNSATDEIYDNIAAFAEKHKSEFRALGGVDWRLHRTHTRLAGSLLREESAASLPELSYFDFRMSIRALSGDRWTLDAQQLLEARQMGIISRIPDVAEDDLTDKNKGDGLVKFLAILQVGWLIVQLIVRAATHKPSSQMEIMTLAYSACAFITYGLLFFRPKDVCSPITLRAVRSPTKAEMRRLGIHGPRYFGPRPFYSMSNTATAGEMAMLTGAMLGFLIFGAIHLIAWGFAFPTTAEQILWRVASLAMTLSPVISYSLLFLLGIMQEGRRRQQLMERFEAFMNLIVYAAGLLLLGTFLIARLFLLVEGLRTMYYLEPAVYNGTWVINAPHLD